MLMGSLFDHSNPPYGLGLYIAVLITNIFNTAMIVWVESYHDDDEEDYYDSDNSSDTAESNGTTTTAAGGIRTSVLHQTTSGYLFILLIMGVGVNALRFVRSTKASTVPLTGPFLSAFVYFPSLKVL